MAYRSRGNMKLEIERNIPGQLPLWEPKAVWTPPVISQLPKWNDGKRVSIDVETRDDDLTTLGPGVRRGAFIVGYAIAIEHGPSFYLPVRHSHGDNVDAEHARQYMEDNAKVFEGEIVGANLSYDLDFLMEAKINFPKVKRFRDIQIAEPLIDETKFSYSMESIASYYELPGKDEKLLREAASVYYVDPKKGLWQLPGRFAAIYGVQDVELPLAILRRQERVIEERGLDRIWDLESRLLPALVDMRRRGVLIDQKRLQSIEDWTMQEQQKSHAKIQELSGIRLAIDDINKAGALEKVLKTIAKIKIGVTAKGQPNIDKAMLSALKNPLADCILRSRKLDKIRNTFAASIRRYMTNGRIHSTFRQMVGANRNDSDAEEKGVRYGRLSSTDPNVQQQPSKDEEYDAKVKAKTNTDEDFHVGKLWRAIYIPEPGQKWAALDYSGQEPRMIVHYAFAAHCEGAAAMVDAYLANPDLDLHQMTSDIVGIDRKPAKIIFLGLAYGMGGAKLCRGLGLPTQWVHSPRLQKMIEIAGPEGQALLARYNEMVPFLNSLRKKCEQRAGERGFITTIMGRQLHFPKKADGTGYDWIHKALNRVVQGSSADQTKLAVVTAYETGEKLQLQVHDEIDMSVDNEAHAERVADIMRHCMKLHVPSKVDVEIGESWGDSM
jgi:DNA polymerase I-like protein with 3'-5' exonuclease and polymerase domains